MRARLHWGLVLLACALGGCRHADTNFPSDPVFATKKPVLSKPDLKPPTVVAYLEPKVPVVPAEKEPEAAPPVTVVGFTVRSQSP
jgi:hypothetical protein